MLCMLGPLHAKRDKIIKHIKRLCWSDKLETGNDVFKTMRSVFLLLAGATLDVIFYGIWMLCVLVARLGLLYFGVACDIIQQLNVFLTVHHELTIH